MNVKLLADTYGAHQSRVTTFLVEYPRFIEPEVLRHRSLSFSAASSRAVNLKKHIEKVSSNYFVPWFTKDAKGMSAKEYLEEQDDLKAAKLWESAVRRCIKVCTDLSNLKVHKQHASRLLQSFEYQEMIITGTQWESFFELRCPKYYIPGYENDFYRSRIDIERTIKKYDLNGFDPEKHNKSGAQPEIQILAERMWDLYNLSVPKTGGIHLPFGYNENYSIEDNIARNVAKCARISYLSDNDDIEQDRVLYNKLKSEFHWSPFEHICFPIKPEDWKLFSTSSLFKDKEGKQMIYTINGVCKNFTGFIPLRFIEENNLDIKRYGNT
jgi:thymidylate synthase ThyX